MPRKKKTAGGNPPSVRASVGDKVKQVAMVAHPGGGTFLFTPVNGVNITIMYETIKVDGVNHHVISQIRGPWGNTKLAAQGVEQLDLSGQNEVILDYMIQESVKAYASLSQVEGFQDWWKGDVIPYA